jgi:pyruvate/2-oxoglutarate dehydrogenase complex dihydrolipoamide acyltransferase (E2) component
VVEPGQRIAVIEAMKMEAPITSTSAGIVATTVVPTGSQVEPGDLIATLTLTDAGGILRSDTPSGELLNAESPRSASRR